MLVRENENENDTFLAGLNWKRKLIAYNITNHNNDNNNK